MKRRIVITGIGVVTPLGVGIDNVMQSLLEGCRSFNTFPSSHVDHQCPARLAALVPDSDCSLEDTREYLTLAEKMLKTATEEALNEAGITSVEKDAGVVVGTGIGGIEVAERFVFNGESHSDGCSVNGLSAHLGQSLASRFRVNGTVSVISTGCSSGNYALARAAELIELGREDKVIVGGVDPHSIIVLCCFNRLGALDAEGIKPFDRERKGTTLAEGAGALIVEELEAALARGAKPLAEVLGIGSSCDAYNQTAPEPSGHQIMLAMARALAEANLKPCEIQAVMAHGTGTKANDAVEAKCIDALFRECSVQPPVTAIKGMIGHSGGGANTITLAAAVKVMFEKRLFPTKGTELLDEECKVNLVTGAPLAIGSGPLLVNSLAFGGNNSIIVLGPFLHKGELV